MRVIAFLLTASGFLISCGERKEMHDTAFMRHDSIAVDTAGSDRLEISANASVAKAETQKFEVVAFQNDSSIGGWGFDIYVDGSRYIHQPVVPVISGRHGFHTKEQSERAGGMMVTKLKEGRMPPALDESDLDLLGLRQPTSSF